MNREEGSVRQLGDQSELNSQKKETLKKEKKKQQQQHIPRDRVKAG